MDTIGGLNVVYYRMEDIRTELANNPALLNHKKFMELIAGYIVVCTLKKEAGLNLMVGLPLKAITKHAHPISGPSLQELINHPKLIDDSDTDICIGDKENINRYQVTRLVSRGDKDRTTDDLIVLLEKKFMVQPDENLTLIVNIEDNISIDIDQMKDFLADKSIPYGLIFVIGKYVINPGKFKCYQIHPDWTEYQAFDIGIPL